MRRVIDNIKNTIRSKTSDEWRAYFQGKVQALRAFVQANGEKAALAGFVLGIVIVLFYKLFILIVTLATLAYLIVITASDRDLS
jgi:hypothetical protein